MKGPPEVLFHSLLLAEVVEFCKMAIFVQPQIYKGSLLPIGREEREVLGVGNIPIAILPSCQDLKTIAL